MSERYFVCFSCGRKVESTAEEPPCEMLNGWLTVLYWKGLGAVEQHNFCSFTCLKKWTDAHAPQIPKIFLESFKEE
jgi:hypothetical protein